VAHGLSRASRFTSAIEQVARAADVFEELQNELQAWLDNMPENLQESAKADELQEAIEALDQAASAALDIVGTDVEFPGMC